MIVFEGQLENEALKYFCKKYVRVFQIIFVISSIIVTPFMVKIASALSFAAVKLVLTLIAILIVVSLVGIPILYKVKGQDLSPKKIYIKDNIICSVLKDNVDSKILGNVKVVCDYGTFYDVVFTKAISNFVCQKDLLTKGTLEEFEALFDGKIIKIEK